MGRGIEKNNKRDTSIEGATIGLQRNLALGNCREVHNNDPDKEPKQ